jgi:hypothetical protein
MHDLPGSLHPAPAPSDPDDETPTGPAVIDPERFEDFPVFRETFLSFVPAAGTNATLRRFAEMLYRFVLEYWQYWPDQPEGQVRGALRAAVADMRHVQGFLLDWAHPETSYGGAHEAHLGKVGGDVARKLGELADRLEGEMGEWRGEA